MLVILAPGVDAGDARRAIRSAALPEPSAVLAATPCGSVESELTATDAAVIVCRRCTVSIAAAERAGRRVRRSDARLLGAVVCGSTAGLNRLSTRLGCRVVAADEAGSLAPPAAADGEAGSTAPIDNDQKRSNS